MSQNARWLFLLILVFGAGCTPSGGFLAPVVTQTAMSQMKIELDVFSGRPNPQWSLSASDEAYLLEKLQNLPEIPSKSFDQPLGYRGMVVYRSDNKPTTYRIWKNLITRDVAGEMTAYQDDNRSLEMWLLLSGKPYLEADLFQMIQQDIETK